MPACLLSFFFYFAYYISVQNYYLIKTEWSNLCKDLFFSGRFCNQVPHCMSLNCSLWSFCINFTSITLIIGGLSIAPFKNFTTRGYLHKRISLQSHKTLLPRGQVNTKKLIHVLKTCRLCRFISDNQNTTLDVLRLSLFLQEKQTRRKSAKRGHSRVLNKNAVSWQIRNNRKLPKHNYAKNLQCLLTFGLVEDNVTVFQCRRNSESG